MYSLRKDRYPNSAHPELKCDGAQVRLGVFYEMDLNSVHLCDMISLLPWLSLPGGLTKAFLRASEPLAFTRKSLEKLTVVQTTGVAISSRT